MTNTEWIRNRLHVGAGLPPETPWPVQMTYNEILLDEAKDGFTKLMHHRMIMGRLRYGKSKRRARFEDLKESMRRIFMYLNEGNQEYLVDAANFLRLEFRHPTHPRAHWNAKDRE